jgi:hypothetical protein
VRGRTEPVDGAECYVIDANTKHGQYTIWIDPEHGYNIARARLIQLREDKYHVLGPRQPQAATIKLTCSLDNVRFEMIDDLWLAMEADIRSHRIFDAKGTFSRSRSHVRLTEVILNPDHEALGSFVPNDIRDGAKIIAFVDLNDGILTAWDPEYRWSSDAKFVVNRKGNWVRYEPDKGMLPVVKALPDLRELELRIEPRQAKDKKVLLCFCDMRQSASKRHVLELRERAASLADKGVILALLQFSAGSTDEVEAWMRKNEIHLPVGIIQDRVKQVLRAWRVQELPWLVLTGRDHVVTAEGFGLNELNGKIEAAN